MIALYTDFGVNGPYIGQLEVAIDRYAPDAKVINLFADAPAFMPKLAGYLLAAYVQEFAENTIFLCVVDPGVGTASSDAVVVEAEGRVFVGPDNGLFDVVAAHANSPAIKRRISWKPEQLSASFHGRDLFAPVAALLDCGRLPHQWLGVEHQPWTPVSPDLDQVVYLDPFGNAMVGRRASTVAESAILTIQGRPLERRRTFGDVGKGEAFWYENANGLVEISVNQGSAAQVFGLRLGYRVDWR